MIEDKGHVRGNQSTLKSERHFRRSTGVDLVIRNKRNYPIRAAYFEYRFRSTLVRFCGPL